MQSFHIILDSLYRGDCLLVLSGFLLFLLATSGATAVATHLAYHHHCVITVGMNTGFIVKHKLSLRGMQSPQIEEPNMMQTFNDSIQ